MSHARLLTTRREDADLGEPRARDDTGRLPCGRPVPRRPHRALGRGRPAHVLGHRTGRHYRGRLAEIYRFLVPPGQRVLELGCGSGDLLAALRPACGVGVDFSAEMVKLRCAAASRASASSTPTPMRSALAGHFDVDHPLGSGQRPVGRAGLLRAGRPRCPRARTRVILNFYSRLWELPLDSARRLGLARPMLHQNWLTGRRRGEPAEPGRLRGDPPLGGIPAGPSPTPLLAQLGQPLSGRSSGRSTELALTNFMVARPKPRPAVAAARCRACR